LGPIGVLVLVDEQVADTPPPLLQQIRLRSEESRWREDQVVESTAL